MLDIFRKAERANGSKEEILIKPRMEVSEFMIKA